MQHRSPEELIQGYKEAYSFFKDEMETKEKKGPQHFITIADQANRIALNYLIIKEKENAIYWFRESTKYYLSATKLLYPNGLRLVDSVVPLHDNILYRKASDAITGLSYKPYSNTGLFEVYLECIASFLRDSPESALDYVSKLRELEIKYWKEVKWYEGLADAVEGIAREDKTLLLNGISRVLEIFKKRNAQLKRIPICTEATSLFILGRRQGIKIELEELSKDLQEFIPEVLVY